MTKLNISSNYMTCDSQGYVGKDMSGVMDIANAILTMGALKKLLLAKNKLCNKEAGKTLATMLAGNTTLKELDVSNNTYYQCDIRGFAQELANGIKSNGALTSLNISANSIGGYWKSGYLIATPEGPKAIAEAIKVHVSIVKPDI